MPHVAQSILGVTGHREDAKNSGGKKAGLLPVTGKYRSGTDCWNRTRDPSHARRCRRPLSHGDYRILTHLSWYLLGFSIHYI